MTVIGLVLMALIISCAAIGLRKSRRNLAAWAIVLGLVYYHPLMLDWSSYSVSRIAYALLYLPLAAMAIYGKNVRFDPPNPSAISFPFGILFGIFAIALIGVQIQVGLLNLQSAKLLSGQVLDNFSSFSILMYASGTICAISELTKYRRRGMLMAGMFVIFFVAFGDRTQPAFIILYGLILYSIYGRIRLFSLLPPILIFLLLYGKQLYVYALTQDLSAFHAFNAVNAGGLAEPIALMKATETGMRLTVHLPSYLHEVLLYLTPISLGDHLHLFQDVYKQIIYPEYSESAGVAGNIILEIYWNYGHFGLPIFGLLLCILVAMFSKLSRHSSNFAMISLLLFVVLFMYLPRNSVFTILSHEKKFIYTFLIAWLMRYMHLKITRRL